MHIIWEQRRRATAAAPAILEELRIQFPALSNWAATRDTLSLYAQAIGVVPRALVKPHAKWWHISLKVQEDGAATDPIPHPTRDGVAFQLLMNLVAHSVDISTTEGKSRSVSMSEGLTSTQFGDRILEALIGLGVEAEVERDKFEDESPRVYEEQVAATYRTALVSAEQVLLAHKSGLIGETGPVQLWPHNFDLAFEWFGTLTVPDDEDANKSYPSQINFGFSPGDSSHDEPYFYSNPWPFQDSLIGSELPAGARWFTDSWKGTILPYPDIAGNKDAPQELSAYFQTVYDLASPLLTR